VATDADLFLRLSAALAARHDVRLAIAFGSRLRGHGRPDSDLDLAVLAPDADLLGLRTDLSPSRPFPYSRRCCATAR
jgi:predicted nucleotidyltransferase